MLCLPLFGTTAAAAGGPAAPLAVGAEEGHVVFGVVSDTHVNETNFTTQGRLAEAFKFFSGTSDDPNSVKLNALCVAGDLTDNGSASQLGLWSQIMQENLSPDVKLVAAMGNHENCQWENFENATGELANAVYEINGYTFITISPGGGTLVKSTMRSTIFNNGWYNYIISWLEDQLEAAEAKAPDKPIFVFFHHPIPNTFYVSPEWNGLGLEKVFNKHPRAVTFAGHIHSPNNNPLSIWQDGGYTAINTVTLKYFELESGMTYGSVPPNAGEGAQGLILDVTGNTVTVYNYDFISKSWIDQTWTFTTADKPEDADMPYTTQKRAALAVKPVFGSDANVTVAKNDSGSVKVTFDQASVPDNTVGDIVHSYQYEFVNTATGNTDVTYKAFSEYYFLPTPATLTNDIGGLTEGSTYDLTIRAVDAYGLVSDDALSVSFTLESSAVAGTMLAENAGALSASPVSYTLPTGLPTHTPGQRRLLHILVGFLAFAGLGAIIAGIVLLIRAIKKRKKAKTA
jgi:Icc-related predicted phosphoesterase